MLEPCIVVAIKYLIVIHMGNYGSTCPNYIYKVYNYEYTSMLQE
jgi:hypothetical protein